MSEKNLEKRLTSTSLEVVPLQPAIKVDMPDAFKDRVKYLCKVIPKVEWSGILLFRPVGTISKPKEFSIILEDIIPMDVGSSAFTSYNITSELMDYFDEVNNPQVETDYQDGKLLIGHIHSH